jgi:hypothetical protein
MTAPTLVTVEAYRADELDPRALARLLDREREDAWGLWLTDDAGVMLADLIGERLDGVDGLDVTAWSLDYYAGAVVEGHVVDSYAFAASLGAPDHDLGIGVTLDAHHGRGVWPGTTYVVVETAEGSDYRDELLSESLEVVVRDALVAVSAWAHEVTSDEAILAGLVEAGWWYDRHGRYLGDVVEVIA